MKKQNYNDTNDVFSNIQNDNRISVIMYCYNINQIGGIETWIYYMCQRLCKYYDITLLFDDAYINQLYRLINYVKFEHRDSKKKYNCDVLLMASNWRPVPNNICYKKLIQTVHSDYEYSKDKLHCIFNIPEGSEVISVSPRTQEALKKTNNCESKVIYNILGNKQNTNKVLHLVTFSRMTIEKGYDRMCILAKKLKDNNIKFDWKIFSTVTEEQRSMINYPEVMFMQPTLDIYDYINDADYLVQLSDSEAFCYSVHESLQYNTPVIVTNLPAFNEFIKDGYNGYYVDLDMKNVDEKWIKNIYENIPNKFTYTEPCSINDWFDVLGTPYELYDNPLDFNNQEVEIEAINDYFDIYLNRYINIGYKYKVNKIRACELTSVHNNAKEVLAKYC